MGKRGPAPLAAEDRRSNSVTVYLTDAERQQLVRQAIPDGADDLPALGVRRRLARYLRGAGLGTLPPQIPAINRDAWLSLSRVVGNLNQYQTAINEGRAGGYPPEVLQDLSDQVQQLRLDLLGENARRGGDE